MLKISAELPGELELWLGTLLQSVFPDGVITQAVDKQGKWIRVTGWLSNQRRLNRLQKQIEDWGGRRFLFEVQKPNKVSAQSTLPIQRIAGFTLVPQGLKEAPSAKRIIRMRQGQAFGTGLHESTRLMLAAIARMKDLSSLDVADIGAGSGVLAFAALHLNAKKVWAIEVDAPSREDLRHNRSLNEISPRKLVVPASGYPSKITSKLKWDVLLANILTPVHEKLMRTFARAVRPGGSLLLAGIHTSAEAARVRKAAKAAKLLVLPGKSLKQWQLVCLKKPASRR